MFAGALVAAENPAALPASDRPFVSPIFGDNMVLQRGKPDPIWGWTKPGETVTVKIGERTGTAIADAGGRWQANVEPPATNEECAVEIDGSQQVVLHHVLVGDVWLCGGQSNMELGLPRVRDAAREIAAANHPPIRLFTVASHAAYGPVDVPRGTWKVCSPQTVAEGNGFSAVAYFFACRVQAETGVPIGLIQDCIGGTPVETWMSPATLEKLPDFAQPMAEVERLRHTPGPEYGNYVMHWFDEYDRGLSGRTWADPALDEHDWKTVQVPGGFADFGLADVPAVVWFRRDFTLPDPLPTGEVTLHLGVVEKMDTSYINGHWVGASSWVENPRAYHVATNLLKPGRNQITVRVFKLKSKTGFLSPPEQIHLDFAGGLNVPLAGEWKAAVSVDARPPHPLPLGYENYPIIPSVLFEGMIKPLAPLALTGAIWYQGEANASRAHQYRTLLPAMIADWRREFQQGDFPFYIVSLPAFQAHRDQPGTDDWAELREAQAFTARTVPNSGLAVMIDTGEADNIHPEEKKPVGERLALVALAQHYGRPVVASGPEFRTAERDGHALRLHFDHADGGLKIHGGTLEEFSVAGADRRWHWATASLDRDDTVIVSSPDVPEPVAVRYAWQANPKATLFNGAGLPAGPFRSDDWPGVTDTHVPW
jgi:sialate O-acetylesterase